MHSDRHIWQAWARKLHYWGVEGWVASFLEAVGPLTILGAQFIYIAEPLINHSNLRIYIQALGNMLEEPELTRLFITELREEGSRQI